jgi:hypothetical protein
MCVITQFQVTVATNCKSLTRCLNLSYVRDERRQRVVLYFIKFTICSFLLIVWKYGPKVAPGAIVDQPDRKLKWRRHRHHGGSIIPFLFLVGTEK